MPARALFSHPEKCRRLKDVFLQPLDQFVESIDGDGSPWSSFFSPAVCHDMPGFPARALNAGLGVTGFFEVERVGSEIASGDLFPTVVDGRCVPTLERQ